MKKLLTALTILAIMNLTFTSCEQLTKETAPELPPLESMMGNLGDFDIEDNTKSTSPDFKFALEETMYNFKTSRFYVAYFNVILTGALGVPVAAFANSFNHTAEFMGDASWEWKYTVDGFGGAYTARLIGTVVSDRVNWEMYLERTGIEAFPEFLWFEGTSELDGMGGSWLLYHSYDYQVPMLQIDWQKSGDEVGDIVYTYVREKKNDGTNDLGTGSYIHAGKTDTELNAFYTIHVYAAVEEQFVDLNIEWSISNYNGRVKSDFYTNGTWQCWDTMGYDIECAE